MFFWREGWFMTGFSVALEAVLKLSLVDQAVAKLTEISVSLLPEC